MTREIKVTETAGEPTKDLGRSRLLCLILATRPAFLTITAVGVLLGWASAIHSHVVLDKSIALVTMILALATHAGVNVINDFHDIDTDLANKERIYPYTGGSRFIQNGVMSRWAVGILGYGLLLIVVGAGLWLVRSVGIGLLGIGVMGLLVGWSYSAPPLRLSARGLGELAVAIGWMLLVVGSDYVQRDSFQLLPFMTGLAYGLMVANLLYIAQFPDATADMSTGKLTIVVRLGKRRAARIYPLIAAATILTMLISIWARIISPWALIALLALFPIFHVYRELAHYAERPHQLIQSIRSTILVTHLFGVLLAAILYLT